jgi:PAS domain S-box-containing protein
MTVMGEIDLDIEPSEAKRQSLTELAARLREAEETLEAIRNGDVDAIVVGGAGNPKVYTLENADRPYRVLIEQMQEGALTLSHDGTILYCNDRFAKTTGVVRESILGNTVYQFFDDGERDTLKQLLARDQGAITSAEFMLRAADGLQVPVNISLVDLKAEEGEQRLVCGVVTDLTHHHMRNRELAAANALLASEIEDRRRAEDSLRLALDAASMGSFDLDLETNMARRSLRHDQIFGYQKFLQAWSFETALEHFVPEDRESVIEAVDRAKSMGFLDLEKRIRRTGDGAVRWLHFKGQTYYEGGKAARIAGVVADVTDQRTLEEQLRHSQKMDAVGQLTGGIAHDFNNLLMIIGGSLDMLSRRMPTDKKTGRLLEAARQGVARGAKLNQQLLAFARRQDLQMEAVCVDDLIPDFEHLLERAVGEMVSVKIERAPRLWHCRTDAHQLETALLNLAINSRDAMPKGGTLTLATENRRLPEPVAASLKESAGDYVVISVADTGTGMPPEVLSRVFEPFFTTKEVGRGTGLGLSQVYGFAKQSGGFVTIESKPMQGTAVSIFLPRTNPPVTVATHASDVLEIKGFGVILVVEDDRGVRETACTMLEELGYDVLEAETGRAALALIERGAPVSLLFTDIIMPDGMNGLELAKEIAWRRPGLPVLLTSGYTAQRLAPGTLAKSQPLLRKPYTQAELSKAVKTAMKDARMHSP